MNEYPSDWKIFELHELVESTRPITYGIVQAGTHIESGIPYIRVSDMTKGYLTLYGMLRTSVEVANQYQRSMVKTGDLVFALRGSPGLVLEVPSILDGANLTQGTARIAPNNLVDGRYLLWALRSKDVQSDILKRVKGSTFVEITLAELRKVRLPLPPLEEQRKIAAILGTWDKAIGLVEQLIEALQARKKGLMQKLLTGEVRFSEFEGEEWEEVLLGEISEIKGRIGWRGYTKDDLRDIGPLVIGATQISQSNILELTNPVYISQEKFEESPDIIVQANDIILVKTGNTIGKVALIDTNIGDATINPNTVIVRTKTGNVRFIYQYMASKFFYAQLWEKVGIGAQPSVNQKDISEMKIPFPTYDEQTRLAYILESCDSEVELFKSYKIHLQEQKRGLMQVLLTGEVRV